MGYLCRSGGEVASISPAADQGRVRPGVQRLGSKHSVVMSRRRGICVGSQGVQDRTRPFPASEYRACGIRYLTVCKTVGSADVGSNPTPATRFSPYISANSASQDCRLASKMSRGFLPILMLHRPMPTCANGRIAHVNNRVVAVSVRRRRHVLSMADESRLCRRA